MKNINEVPITVLRALEPFVKTKSDFFELTPDQDTFVHFVGKEELLGCYFKIIDYYLENGKFMVSIIQKPQNEHVVGEWKYKCSIEEIKRQVDKWSTYLVDTRRLQAVFLNNERTENIANEFFNESPFSDTDFDNEYFSISEATELSHVCGGLIEYVRSTNDIKNKEEIIEEITFLEINSTQESKRKLAKRFAKIKALMVKNGPKVLKTISDIGVNVAGNVIAKMITG